ncbi:MAG TPA: universal stress protein [Blastocatellia bacterium]|nr:universal stress protein [Blastocatellia bacterium]
MKVLMALDCSSYSDTTVTEFLKRPWPSNTVVKLVSIIDLSSIQARAYLEPYIKDEVDAAEKMLGRAADKIHAKGIDHTVEVLKGYPRTAIVDYAAEQGADLIVVGSHGRSDLARFFLGSVAKSVVGHAHCSVEIVRPSDRPEAAGGKILLATDGSEFSVAAASFIAGRPWPQHSEVLALSVVEPVTPAIDPWYSAGEAVERIREENTRHAEEAVQTAANIIAAGGLKVEKRVITGHPRYSIVDEAREWGADLVAAGSHGRRGVTRLLLGSVSEAVAMHAHCSVDVIRIPHK